MLQPLVDGTPESAASLRALAGRGANDLEEVAPVVRDIVAGVRRGGADAVLRFVEVYERRRPERLVSSPYGGEEALGGLDPATRKALEAAADRIRRYHERQRDASLGGFTHEEGGVELGMRVRPLARAGVYAPGGKARYPSSVLMAAIPARVAGVREIVLASPSPDDVVRAAAHLAGVTTLLDAGGAHAIAALAYGLAPDARAGAPEGLPRVDKIVGPGNAYVACAKRMVYGDVALDGLAGPSEVLVVADADADPELVAADLASQAEHDEQAWAVLVTTSSELADAVARRLPALVETLPRRAIVERSLRERGAIHVVATRERAAALAAEIAAEHVALHVADPAGFAEIAGPAGAVLLGGLTPVATGDYYAGPSHVLPTGGSARFGAPLGVYDFVTRTSTIRYGREALAAHAADIATLARAEGLEAHARAVEARLRPGVGR